MIVKYYGDWDRDKDGKVIEITSIWCFHNLSTEELVDRFPNPSQCIWLVPGTYDEDGDHVR